MDAIDERQGEILGEGDARSGLALSAEAGWNQTLDDWRLFLLRGTVFGARDREGRVVATAALLPYRPDAAWISLVLVTSSWRRRGLARLLTGQCIALAAEAEWRIGLDATPAGATVYGPLGFAAAESLLRMRRSSAASSCRDEAAGDLDALLAFDREALGLDRAAMLRHLAERPGSRIVGGSEACCLVRDGYRARHVGPVYGRRVEAVESLLDRVLRSEVGELVVDLHDRPYARAFIERWGFVAERPFLRMVRGGPERGQSVSTSTVAGAGPEYG